MATDQSVGNIPTRVERLAFRLSRLFRAPTTSHEGVLIEASDDSGITDGVDYSQPHVMPSWVQRRPAQAKAMLESLQESAASKYRSQFGEPFAQNAPVPVFVEDPLEEWSWQVREMVISHCHAARDRNPLAYAIVEYTTLFVVGDGFNLDIKNQDVEKVLQEFIDNPDNAIREYERQAVSDLQTDGELILRLFTEAGQVAAAPQRPWELESIKTEPGFFRRVIEYNFQRTETEGDAPDSVTTTIMESVPADEIIFVAINRRSYELRGRPELYRLLPWLRADTEWLSDRARQSKWRNALLYVVNVANATATTLAAVASRWKKAPSPGSVAVESSNVEVNAVNNSSNAADAMNDGRMIRLMNLAGALMPEYMFGDGKQANLATATKQELPALAKFEHFQQIMIRQLWEPLFKRVIQEAVDAGRLPMQVTIETSDGDELDEDQGGGQCDCLDAFEVTYEPVTQQDIQALTNALNMQAMNGWISDKTAQEKLGLDPHVEAKRLAMEQEQKRDEMAQGLRPVPPGMDQAMGDTGDGMDDDDEEDVQSGQNGRQSERAA